MPRMKNKTRALILPAFCNILKATVIKSIWWWHNTDRPRNRIQNLGENFVYGVRWSSLRGPIPHSGERTVSLQMMLGKQFYMKRMVWDPYLIPFTKKKKQTNLQWM
jgi:hypothetical protein